MDGSEPAARLLRLRAERPLNGTIRNLGFGTLIAALWMLANDQIRDPRWEAMAGYLIVGNCISFFGWGAERLWYATV